ncbi:MAG TPA: hypothetical protein DCM86_10080 [Verrucomicrobiales bacterium]|nr:hypothetical protein [Verrucomicrobiales bacterium]
MNITLSSLVLLATLGLTACSEKKSEPPAANSTTSSGNPITAPVDYLGAVAKAQHTSVNKLSLVGITQAIQQYQALEGHLPKTLDDLVTAKVLEQIPTPPQGMKFSYNPATGEVSVVAK